MTEKTDRPHVLMMSEITADGKLTLKKGVFFQNPDEIYGARDRDPAAHDTG